MLQQPQSGHFGLILLFLAHFCCFCLLCGSCSRLSAVYFCTKRIRQHTPSYNQADSDSPQENSWLSSKMRYSVFGRLRWHINSEMAEYPSDIIFVHLVYGQIGREDQKLPKTAIFSCAPSVHQHTVDSRLDSSLAAAARMGRDSVCNPGAGI